MSINVLILSTRNSANSIIAEAVLQKYLTGVQSCSAGLKPSGTITQNTKKVLEENHLWNESYHSKPLSEVATIAFDLIVVICDKAANNTPDFPDGVEMIQIDYEDITSDAYSTYTKRLKEIQMELLPIVRMHLGL